MTGKEEKGTPTMTPTEAYRAIRNRGDGRTQTEACYELMESHGLTGDEAADVCCRAETGKPAPRWAHADGSPTFAAEDWAIGADRAHDED